MPGQGTGSRGTEGRGIKLKARDRQDLEVLAACLQDAVVTPRDMTWLRKEKRFVLVGTRFRWEREPDAVPPPAEDEDASFAQAQQLYSRVNCGVAFDKVTRVQARNLEPARRGQLLNLLTLRLDGQGADGQAIRLVFSAGVEIRLEVTGISAFLEDLGEAWPTPWRPDHAADAGEREGREQEGQGPEGHALDDQAPAG